MSANLTVADNVDVGDNVSVGNILDVTGNATIGGTLGVTGDTSLSANLTVGGRLDTRGAAENALMDNLTVENLEVTNYIWPTFIQRGENTYQVTSATNVSWFSMDCYYSTAWGSGEVPNVVVTAENLDEASCDIVTIDGGSVTESKFTVLIENTAGGAVLDSYIKVHWIAVYYT